MYRAGQKTKIVATVGPASDSPEVLRAMIDAGLDVVRLNFSHGNPEYHGKVIARVRQAAKEANARVTILGDLPGPKMRIGKIASGPIELEREDEFILTTNEVPGDQKSVSISFLELPSLVKPGDQLHLNDGFILLEVRQVVGNDIHCRVVVGGELSSNKGLNVPGIDLGIRAFTDNDHEWLRFAAAHGVDAVSQSFVACVEDILDLRKAADALDYHPFVIAKIERASVLDRLEEVLKASDGVMVARGDLGVEIPIERIAVVQKQITDLANRLGKPVITATQMLESMVNYPRPTRAEATDVANAILGGTDCIMLSGESAMGRYPVESVTMLARIATEVELERTMPAWRDLTASPDHEAQSLIASSVYHNIQDGSPVAIVVPSRSGGMVRSIARFRPTVWIVAFSTHHATCQALQLSYGVYPILIEEPCSDWSDYARRWLAEHGLSKGIALLIQGPNERDPHANYRLEILELKSSG